MCGIAGYIGTDRSIGNVTTPLERLLPRGYDSAGVAEQEPGGKIVVFRAAGETCLTDVQQMLQDAHPGHQVNSDSCIKRIGHTRWATHGCPTTENAHPHRSRRVAVVHNGMITNFEVLREELQKKGYYFVSQTDTEIIAHLVDLYLSQGMKPVDATRAAIIRLQGTYAVALLFEGQDLLIVACNGNPLVVGFAEGGTFIGSMECALVALAHSVLHLKDGDIGVVARDGATIYDADWKVVEREVKPLTIDDLVVGKGEYKHYTEKEIFEQAPVINKTLRSLYALETGSVQLPQLPFDPALITQLLFVGCGTASYASLVALPWFKSLGIPVDWQIASEFIYNDDPIVLGQAAIVLSQSGETLDTLLALRKIKSRGVKVLAIVNAAGSVIAREADAVIHTSAGPEYGVASTKAFTTQLAVLASLAIGFGRARGTLSPEKEVELTHALLTVPDRVEDVLRMCGSFMSIAEVLAKVDKALFVGRGMSAALSKEAELKLKEISYIHAQAHPAGEFKHGHISLIDENIWTIALAPPDHVFEPLLSNLQQIKGRGGKIIFLSDSEGCGKFQNETGISVALPTVHSFVHPFVYAVAVQLIAYYTAVLKGTNVDKPRNLAKSVTVE